MKITSKRHLFKFYFGVAFGFTFLIFLGTMLMISSIDLLQNEHPKNKEYFLPVISIAMYLVAFMLLYSYFRNAPIITIEGQTIKFAHKTFDLNDIKKISFTGKKPFRFIITFPMEGTTLKFNDGTEKTFFDDLYSNSWKIKSFLEQTIIEQKEYKPSQPKKVDRSAIQFENREVFKGNQFTSLRGISLWGLLLFFAIFVLNKGGITSIRSILILFFFAASWFILQSWLMHYFELTKKYLIIRNHNFIWITKIYDLSEIKEVIFETEGKQPNCMRVITKDFKSRLYPAGTLRDENWLALKSKLENEGVLVRNECIFEE